MRKKIIKIRPQTKNRQGGENHPPLVNHRIWKTLIYHGLTPFVHYTFVMSPLWHIDVVSKFHTGKLFISFLVLKAVCCNSECACPSKVSWNISKCSSYGHYRLSVNVHWTSSQCSTFSTDASPSGQWPFTERPIWTFRFYVQRCIIKIADLGRFQTCPSLWCGALYDQIQTLYLFILASFM